MAAVGRILLVDDEPLVLEMFAEVFRGEGYDVVCSTNTKDAVSQLERSYFDALVADVNMDGLDGFDLLGIARKKNERIGVILITGAPSKADAIRAEELRAGYLSKPIDLDLMLSTVIKHSEPLQEGTA